MLKKTLLICASVLSVHAASSSSTFEASHPFSAYSVTEQQNPLLFAGIELFDSQTLSALRLFSTKTREEILFPTPELEATYKHECQKLCSKLGVVYDENLSMADIFFLPLKELLKSYVPNPEEVALFDATPLSKFCREFVKNGTKTSPTHMESYSLLSKIQDFNNSYYSMLYNIIEPVMKEFKKQNEAVYVPIIGKAELGFALLISCYLDNIFPIGCYKDGGRAHGVDFTGVGFAVHDIAHALSATTHQEEINHLESILTDYAAKGYAPRDIATVYMPIMIAKHKLHQETYHTFLKHIVESADNKSLVSLFLMVHEYGLSRNYKSNNLLSTMEQAIEEIKTAIQQEAEGSIIEGMTDEEIVKNIIKKQHGLTDDSVVQIIFDSLIRPLSVSRLPEHNPRYIAVKPLEKINGQQLFHKTKYLPTQDQLIYDAEDFEKVLGIAGVAVEADKTDGPAYLKAVNENLVSLFDDFKTTMAAFAEKHGEMYRASFDSLEEKFQESLKALPVYDPQLTKQDEQLVSTSLVASPEVEAQKKTQEAMQAFQEQRLESQKEFYEMKLESLNRQIELEKKFSEDLLSLGKNQSLSITLLNGELERLRTIKAELEDKVANLGAYASTLNETLVKVTDEGAREISRISQEHVRDLHAFGKKAIDQQMTQTNELMHRVLDMQKDHEEEMRQKTAEIAELQKRLADLEISK